jgi:four helix bundle protein
MKIEKFEDLIAWQKAQSFTVLIYKEFAHIKDYSFKDQICRASVSISNNIAEGFDRGSKKEFIRFLCIAHASCSEVKSMLYLAMKLEYFSQETMNTYLTLGNEISIIIRGLISACKKNV